MPYLLNSLRRDAFQSLDRSINLRGSTIGDDALANILKSQLLVLRLGINVKLGLGNSGLDILSLSVGSGLNGLDGVLASLKEGSFGTSDGDIEKTSVSVGNVISNSLSTLYICNGLGQER